MTPYNWQKTNLTEAVKTLTPTWHGEFENTSTRIITDTRKLEAGDIFLAIKGDNFDGHDYLQTAKDNGAILAIVSRPVVMQRDSELPQLIVSNTKLALGKLGEYRRDQHPNLKVVAITGSSGKTTAKEMLGSILSQLAPTLITRGNLNNDLGVPMMLLELCDEHQFAVMELGANHLGEIAYTTKLVKPDVACILNIGTAHLGEFGGQQNIANAKAEIFQSLNHSKIAVLPFGDGFFESLEQAALQFTSQILTFGEQESTFEKAGVNPSEFFSPELLTIEDENSDDVVYVMGDVFADDVEIFTDYSTFSLNVNLEIDEVQSADIRLNFAGEHNISNALAAAACATALGVPLDVIAAGLQCAKPAKGRLNSQQFGKHTLIDDTYNANPHAVRAAAAVLKSHAGNTMLVLGDIGELGEAAQTEHETLGNDIAKIGIDVLFTLGEMTPFTVASAKRAGMAAVAFTEKDDLVKAIQQKLAQSGEPWTILFKGSRYMAMETIISALVKK